MSLANNGAPIQDQRDAGSLAICAAINLIEMIGDRYSRSEQVSITPVEAGDFTAVCWKA